MRPFIRYISPLLICGLMLPLCYTDTYYIGITGKSDKINCMPVKKRPVKALIKQDADAFSFFKDVVSNIAPALKNLR